MGYTHYYRYDQGHPEFLASWPAMARDAGRIVDQLQAAGVIICGPDDGTPPVTPDGIALGGSVEDELDGELFEISPGSHKRKNKPRIVQGFCKTERFPYDVAVAAILLRCHILAPQAFLIASDGQWDEEWREDLTWPRTGLSARGLVAELFGDAPAESVLSDPAAWHELS
jgi:hypothetical protein